MAVPALVYTARRRRRRRLHRRAGPSRPRPTSPSRSPCSRSSAPRCRPRCARSCSPSPSSTTSFAILIIAVFFTDDLNFAALGVAVVGLGVFWLLLRKDVRGWYVYVPLALVIWALMHASGVHATIAGVAMGLMLRCTRREGEEHSPAEHIEHLVRPLSAGLAVPLFALFSAGVAVSGDAARPTSSPSPSRSASSSAWSSARPSASSAAPGWPPASPGPSSTTTWPGPDVFAVATLAGIGFTVSLLIGELAFTGDPALTDEVKAAVLIGSLIAALFAGDAAQAAGTDSTGRSSRTRSATRTATASRTSTNRTTPSTTCGWPRSTRRRPPSTAAAGRTGRGIARRRRQSGMI